MAGVVTAALLFPTHGVTGCSGGVGGGCETRNVNILIEYPGENGAIGMAIAIGVGIAIGFSVYLIARWISRLALQKNNRSG